MAKVIDIEKRRQEQKPEAPSDVIDVSKLQRNTVASVAGLITPAKEETHSELAPEHAAEPIKNLDDIYRISDYLIKNGRYRDNMLFIVGINFGLRVSDLRRLHFSDIINDNFTFRTSFPIFEQKTRNTRKKKLNRYITINTAVIEAVTLYLQNTPGVSLSDLMFKSNSNKEKNREAQEPLSRQSVDRILKGIANDLNLNIRFSTHSLRKTFCYWMMIDGNNDQRRLLLLQKMLNHSSPAQTLDYIGITGEEMEAAYKALNLGSEKRKGLIDSRIVEMEVS